MKKRQGFTLIELLVVIAIIGILVGLLVPAVQMAREAGRRTSCINNLKQWSLGVAQYEQVFDCYPGTRFGADMGSAGYSQDIGWMVSVLPYIEQQTLYDRFEDRTFTFAAVNANVVSANLQVNRCPSAEVPEFLPATSEFYGGPRGNVAAIVGDYAGNNGYVEIDAPFQVASTRKKEGAVPVYINGVTAPKLTDGAFRDGKSNTFLLWESAGTGWVYHDANNRRVEDTWDNFMATGPSLIVDEAVPVFYPSTPESIGQFAGWAGINTFQARMWDDTGTVQGTAAGRAVVNRTNAYRSPFSYHPNIVIVARVDGSVDKIVESISWPQWAAQCSRNGGEVVNQD